MPPRRGPGYGGRKGNVNNNMTPNEAALAEYQRKLEEREAAEKRQLEEIKAAATLIKCFANKAVINSTRSLIQEVKDLSHELFGTVEWPDPDEEDEKPD